MRWFDAFGAQRFQDRAEAGLELARELERYRGGSPAVLGLPRGGVVVASQIARALDAELGVIIIRKIGAPYQPELAVGAVADNGAVVVNTEVVAELGITQEYLERETARQLAEIRDRLEAYGSSRLHGELAHRTVIVVDDGAATGASMKVAIRAVREERPKWVVAALPVAPRETVVELEGLADDVVCLLTPPNLIAVGLWYHDFEQVTDDEVRSLLAAFGRPGRTSGPPAEGGDADGATTGEDANSPDAPDRGDGQAGPGSAGGDRGQGRE